MVAPPAARARSKSPAFGGRHRVTYGVGGVIGAGSAARHEWISGPLG